MPLAQQMEIINDLLNAFQRASMCNKSRTHAFFSIIRNSLDSVCCGALKVTHSQLQ